MQGRTRTATIAGGKFERGLEPGYVIGGGDGGIGGYEARLQAPGFCELAGIEERLYLADFARKDVGKRGDGSNRSNGQGRQEIACAAGKDAEVSRGLSDDLRQFGYVSRAIFDTGDVGVFG